MRAQKIVISSIVLLLVLSESCAFKFFWRPREHVEKTTPRCSDEDLAECPVNTGDCQEPNEELRQGGPKDCCDICYTILDKGQTCDDPATPYAVCAPQFFCINSKCL
ncbi:uncharacterized protein [Leptinotarsa decemlineata]|uniref:uncharacterized protein n=1 Tax=Leptinotarsa decemlineata TaxID=7539 RepID=UPI003D308102